MPGRGRNDRLCRCECIGGIFAFQVAPAVAAVADDMSEVRARSGFIASQLLGLALTRYVLWLPPVAEMSRADVVRWVGPTIQRYLTGR